MTTFHTSRTGRLQTNRPYDVLEEMLSTEDRQLFRSAPISLIQIQLTPDQSNSTTPRLGSGLPILTTTEIIPLATISSIKLIRSGGLVTVEIELELTELSLPSMRSEHSSTRQVRRCEDRRVSLSSARRAESRRGGRQVSARQSRRVRNVDVSLAEMSE